MDLPDLHAGRRSESDRLTYSIKNRSIVCYYKGLRVSRADFIRLKGIEKELKGLKLNRPAQSGFLYRDWPIIRATSDRKSFSVDEAHWEFIPEGVGDEEELKNARKAGKPWLNAKSENLFVNEKGKRSMWADAALNGRCLVMVSYFFEFRHIPMIGKKGRELKATRSIPYCITMKEKTFDEFFVMAGIWREWTNIIREQSAATFATVTQPANNFMAAIHNTAKRMPMILPDEGKAARWIKGGQNRLQVEEMVKERLPSSKLIGWTVAPDFLKKENPEEPFIYPDVPDLVWDGEEHEF
jgi:putative SOS response-associated peptidase YedK